VDFLSICEIKQFYSFLTLFGALQLPAPKLRAESISLNYVPGCVSMCGGNLVRCGSMHHYCSNVSKISLSSDGAGDQCQWAQLFWHFYSNLVLLSSGSVLIWNSDRDIWCDVAQQGRRVWVGPAGVAHWGACFAWWEESSAEGSSAVKCFVVMCSGVLYYALFGVSVVGSCILVMLLVLYSATIMCNM
jgi:hypothetical protein